jgi:hypothetical protein
LIQVLPGGDSKSHWSAVCIGHKRNIAYSGKLSVFSTRKRVGIDSAFVKGIAALFSTKKRAAERAAQYDSKHIAPSVWGVEAKRCADSASPFGIVAEKL